MTSEQDVLEHLAHLARFGTRLGLERMEETLARLGNPHKQYPAVHVAGTNGKGSTSAMIAAIARAAGLRVGLYTSPHLVHFCERIVVDGRPIAGRDLAEAFDAARAAAEEMTAGEPPTHFEFTTAMAFLHFARRRVDLAVVEVGMGGRLDATNVLRPELCVITPVGLDHTAVLGPTVEAIAFEKAGIIKPGVEVVSAPQVPAAAAVIARRAREVGARSFTVVERALPGEGEYAYRAVHAGLDGGRFDLSGPEGELAGIGVSLLGAHQLQNGAVAAAAARRLAAQGWRSIDERALRRGLASVQWPGRLQRVHRSPDVVLDGAHNPPAAQALEAAVRGVFGRRPDVVVLGMLREKDVAGVVRTLVGPGVHVIATRARSGRSAPIDPTDLASLALRAGAAGAEAAEPPAAAVAKAMEQAGTGGLVLVTGSLYMVGEVLAASSVLTARTS